MVGAATHFRPSGVVELGTRKGLVKPVQNLLAPAFLVRQCQLQDVNDFHKFPILMPELDTPLGKTYISTAAFALLSGYTLGLQAMMLYRRSSSAEVEWRFYETTAILNCPKEVPNDWRDSVHTSHNLPSSRQRFDSHMDTVYVLTSTEICSVRRFPRYALAHFSNQQSESEGDLSNSLALNRPPDHRELGLAS